MGYTKNIAVIRGIKSGFSADGGELSGLVKAEKYGSSLKIEVSLINFAPLTEGKFTVAVSDGRHIQVLDGLSYEGISEVDTGRGFASLICFVRGEVLPVATAVCGNFRYAVTGIREEIERQEKINADRPSVPQTAEAVKYEDEALAQENYYEYGQTDEDGGAVRENSQKEEDGHGLRKDEKAESAFGQTAGGLARGGFYERMKDEIENIFAKYPEERALVDAIEGSRWVRIDYGEGKFYVFGVIYAEGFPAYICYGVPSADSSRPPESLAGLASYFPAGSGYWVMYQDASTGASVKIENN